MTATPIRLRRATAAQWEETNPTIGSGEPCYETDTGHVKVGDGTTPWAQLPYVAGRLASRVDQLADRLDRVEHHHRSDVTVWIGSVLAGAGGFWASVLVHWWLR